MFVGSLLDSSGRSLAQALALIAVVLITTLLVAMSIPVVVLFSLMHPQSGTSGQGTQSTEMAETAQATHAPGTAGNVSAPSASQSLSGTAGEPAAVQVAHRYLGVPYVFGGTNPAVGLDCSGLVQLVFQQIGIRLPRTAQQQYEATQRVNRDQLQPGDLVFFAHTYADPNDWVTHVGIYIGNGQQINAPTEGERVSVQPVFTGFWGAHFVSGGRPTTR